MEIRQIMHTARSVTIEIADGGRYFTKQPIELRLNGETTLTTEKTDVYKRQLYMILRVHQFLIVSRGKGLLF